jgi:hypothetical protein
MPVYGAGSKYLGLTEKETEWLRFHEPQPPGNSHCRPTSAVNRYREARSRGAAALFAAAHREHFALLLVKVWL